MLFLSFINYAIDAYILIIIIRAFFSWINPSPLNPVYIILWKLTEPLLKPIRRRIGIYYSGNIGIDLSPIILILALTLLKRLLFSLII